MKEPKKFTMKSMEIYNVSGLSDYAIAKRSGLSHPAVQNYMGHGSRASTEPSLPHIAALLSGMGIDIDKVSLGELVGVVDG